jgi:hypothetical protein
MTTIKYHQADDGKQMDGKTVVWIDVPKEDVAWVEEMEEQHGGDTDGGAAHKATDDKKKAGDKDEKDSKGAAKKKSAQSKGGGKKGPSSGGAGPNASKAAGKSSLAQGKNALKAQKIENAKLTAAALTSAAKDGKPFCEECEKARQEIAAKKAKQQADEQADAESGE